MFVERKVTAALRGGEPFRHFSAIQGLDALRYTVCLVLNLLIYLISYQLILLRETIW